MDAELRLEVVSVPVTDIDKALAFYTEQVGFALDVDHRPTAEFRVVQLTPACSACSIQLVAAEGSARLHGLVLVTSDLGATRDELHARGIDVGPVRHKHPVDTWAGGWRSGSTGNAATTPASPTSPIRTATPGHCRNAGTSRPDNHYHHHRTEKIMGLSWQQGPLAQSSVGRFLTDQPLPDRLLFVEPLRRRMRVQFGDEWIADSEDVLLLHEPGHYPVALFPRDAVRSDVLVDEHRTTEHRELGTIAWFGVAVRGRDAARSAWQYVAPPEHADELRERVGFAWRAMDAFYEEDERIVGHAADPYHRIDLRQSSRHLVVKAGERVVADTIRPIVLFESGFAPRWYVPRADVEPGALAANDAQTFCPYKGLADYYDIDGRPGAAWSYPEAWPEVARVSGFVSFEPDKVDVFLDGTQLALEPGQTVIAHGIDRGLDPDEIRSRDAVVARS